MRKKITIALAAAVLAELILTGCTSGNTPSDTGTAASSSDTSAVTEAPVSETTTETTPETTVSQTETTTETTPTETEPETSEETTVSQTETTAAEPFDPTVDERYKKAYSAKLAKMANENKDKDELSQMWFSVYDIGGNGTPELMISTGEFHAAAVEIYSLDKNGNVVFTGVAGSTGELYYFPETRQINSMYGGMGGLYNELYEIKDGKLENICSLTAYNEYDGINGKYTEIEASMNGSPCTKEEYYAAFDEWFGKQYITLGRSYPLYPEVIEAVFEPSDPQTAYDRICTCLAENSDDHVVYSKCLTDLNGDGVDELITTYDYVFDGEDIETGYSLMIYTYRDGLVCMGQMPQYYETPTSYYDMMDMDISYEGGEPVYRHAVNREKRKICTFCRSSYDEIYTAEYTDDLVLPGSKYSSYKMNDGTYEHYSDTTEVDEFEYDTLVQGFYADEYEDLEFEVIALG